MPEPTDEEILERIRQFSRERRETAESDRRYVSRPEKYADPIGIDPEGKPYPVHRE